MMGDLSRDSRASIVQCCEGWAETKVDYRLLSNEAVEWSAILKPHRVKTMARMAQYERVLCIQDTTELDFTGHPSIQGLGRLNHALGTGWFVIRRWR